MITVDKYSSSENYDSRIFIIFLLWYCIKIITLLTPVANKQLKKKIYTCGLTAIELLIKCVCNFGMAAYD